jgi:hypothetical protein
LRERSADYSQNSSISAFSLCIFVVGSGGGGDGKMAAMAAVKCWRIKNLTPNPLSVYSEGE